ncbi:MAG: T9SS type A sorting domain-containing protein [Bacteroidia bacterium]
MTKNNKLVYPGDPYRSFLFRKINNGLAYNVDLSNEGSNMPLSAPALNDKQIELVRQWIIYGAQETGNVIDTALISSFYDDQGIESVPNPPLPPVNSEGFQIHLGPILLPPFGENVFLFSGGEFSRFDYPGNSTTALYKMTSYAGEGHHHFTLFSNTNTNLTYGLQYANAQFQDSKFLMSSQQIIDTLEFPSGTGVFTGVNEPLIVNVHYFNPYPKTMACDFYVNLYTKSTDEVVQEMKFSDNGYPDNPNNPPFYILPDGLEHTFEYDAYNPGSSETRYVWAVMGHSHARTVKNIVYLRNTNGTKGEKIYEAGCYEGIPGCISPYFDAVHVPTRYLDNYLPLNLSSGLIQEASYINNGPDTIFYGPWANESEMMVFGYYYVSDTTALGIIENHQNTLSVYPNPFSGNFYIECSEKMKSVELFDLSAKSTLKKEFGKPERKISMDCLHLISGVYILKIITEEDNSYFKRIICR